MGEGWGDDPSGSDGGFGERADGGVSERDDISVASDCWGRHWYLQVGDTEGAVLGEGGAEWWGIERVSVQRRGELAAVGKRRGVDGQWGLYWIGSDGASAHAAEHVDL